MTSLRNPDPTAVPPPSRDELAAWLRLALTHGVGPATALTLLSAFGSARAVIEASHGAVSRVAGAALATRLVRPDPELDQSVAESLHWAENPDNNLLTLADPAYPRCLLDIPDPPPLLFVQGDISVLAQPAFALVGSRQASLSGIENAGGFAAHLAGAGLCIVSGLAKGIDAAAHQGAIDAEGKTIAVLGTGIDRVYPVSNLALAGRIAANGAIISEFPLGSGPLKSHFPRRNRLIAGLAAGVLVVEAARRSGSLITARLAGEFGRDVFAIPGSIHSPLARGCHQLIRDGARLVETADDIISELRPDFLTAARATRPATMNHAAAADLPNPTESSSSALLEVIGWEPVSHDLLVQALGCPAGELDELLLDLELNGWLERLPDGRLQRLKN